MVHLLALPLVMGAYSPPDMGLDAWFLLEGETWHQFQLAGPCPWDLDKPWPPLNEPDRTTHKGVEQGIHHSVSKDLITWEDRGIVLTVGPIGAWDDGLIYTGNIAKHDGKYYLFYTGIPREHRPDAPCLTPIGVAVSEDLVHWEKHPRNPVLTPDPKYYNPNGDWRDCIFYRDEAAGWWYAVVTATAATDEHAAQGQCIGLARSRDLIAWECLPPIAGSTRYDLGLENPFLFQREGVWYTGHSMYGRFFSERWREEHPDEVAEGGLYYFTAPTMTGPYTLRGGPGLQPDPPIYACQIISWKGERLLMHRGPDRWATALPKRIAFLDDGRMEPRYWPGVEQARKESLAQVDAETPLRATDAPVVVGAAPLDCFFEARIALDAGAKAELALGDTFRVGCDRDAGAIYAIDPATSTPRADRTAEADLTEPVHLRLVAEGSVVEAYANDVLLFLVNRPQPATHEATIAIVGSGTADRVALDRLDAGNTRYQYGFNY